MKSQRINFARFIFILFIFITSSCGYQLNKINKETVYDLYITLEESDLNNLLLQNIKRGNNFKLLKEKSLSDNSISIEVEEHSIKKYSAAIGQDGKTKEVRIEYLFRFTLYKESEDRPISKVFKSNSFYTYDDSSLLSMEDEEILITKELVISSLQNLTILIFSL